MGKRVPGWKTLTPDQFRAEFPPPLPGEPEKLFQRWVSRFAEVNGWLPYHTLFSLGSHGGFPDLVLVRGDRVLFVELKRSRKEKLKPAQETWKLWLTRANQVYYVWTPELIDGIVKILK